ncbi:MAG: T9SS type A sorting domain-containing protein, partial [Saprospiraceae bacterium]|nr:T9SS type A sorting domain-containing protein [Saprospiraceae bacterium]
VYTNTGGLTFSSKTIYNTTKTLESIDLADFDNDGDVDVLAGLSEISNEQVVIFQNNGNGNYIRKDIQKNDFDNLTNVYAADVNIDGKMDILATSLDGVWIWENKGSLTFEKKEVDTPSDHFFIGASVADYTGEGNPDIVVGTHKEFQWYKNTSLVDYTYEQKVINGLTGAFDIVSVDLNNDGAKDVITSNGSLWWYQNKITQLPSGLEDDIIKDYQIYPNPVFNEISIKGLHGDGFSISIYNQLGQEVMNAYLTGDKANVQSLTPGRYIMTIHDINGTVVGKESIIKQ